MEHRNGSNAAITSQRLDRSPGSYALRELITDVPLSSDENGVQAHITCVDTWNGNLYIGTSSGEILHYVSLPPDPSAHDEHGSDQQAGYIFATSIEPPYFNKQEGPDAGIKQILLLPSIDKACVLCNGTLTFYTLPELTPAYGGIKQGNCLWVGGLDRDWSGENEAASNGQVAVTICRQQNLLVINLGKEGESRPRKIKHIELGGVAAIERRGDLACVANGSTYSLLDMVNQRQNVLFPISSVADAKPLPELPQNATTAHSRQPSAALSAAASPARQSRSHERSTSNGGTQQSTNHSRADSGSPWPARNSSRQLSSPAPPPSRGSSPPADPSADAKPPDSEQSRSPVPRKPMRPIQANLLSPTATEFFLTTGTTTIDAGIGMFVDLNGDVVRGTMEFSSYPESLVLDGYSQTMPATGLDVTPEEGYMLAIVCRNVDRTALRGIEIQRWDVDPGELHRTREWLPLGPVPPEEKEDVDNSRRIALRNATSTVEVTVTEISTNLKLRRFRIKDEPGQLDIAETKQNQKEDEFASHFSRIQANVLLIEAGKVSWVIRNPLIMQLDQQLNLAMPTNEDGQLSIDVPAVQRVVNSIRGQDARDELEFRTLTYVRQKAALLLFGNLFMQAASNVASSASDKTRAEETLIDSVLDPRPVLALVPPLSQEIAEGPQGIWIPQGLRKTINTLGASVDTEQMIKDTRAIYVANILHVVKNYLLAWRKKKGFGSVADETHVFHSVDAALLHVLLILDRSSPRGPASRGSIRAELNSVVQNGVECFDRAVELFEKFDRLYMLSRLYQSRKMISHVLVTWKRILEGERDAGGEFINGEQELRGYLTRISNPALVQEYGCWLANRNPKLGVQVFADDKSKVKFQPADAVAVLRERAPGAVKDYLEHLVFGKNHVQYVNDLIAFYLDTVLTELEQSADARNVLVQSYETYRALQPPKPTYRQFITDNAIDAEWWRNRLRLLQLIGGSHGAASRYNVQTLGQRLAPYSAELVPEMIILHGRQGAHEAALRLLVHALGDYDTAIRYCLLGGAHIFHVRSGAVAESRAGESEQPAPPSHAEQSALFEALLHEFFALDDADERRARCAELLERFGGWLDAARVLELLPPDWPVELVAGFLTHALRRLVRERHETDVVKALCSAQNLRRAVAFADVCEKAGATFVADAPAAGGNNEVSVT